jgi:hypothetical protein
LARGGVDDADVEVLDEQDDVGPADADVAEPASDAQGDGAGFADGVVADSVVGVTGAVGVEDGFRPGLVGGGRRGPAGQGSGVVVLEGEGVRQRLQLGDHAWLLWLGAEPF